MKCWLSFLCLIHVMLGYSQEQRQAFLPNIIKQFPNVRDVAISPDGNEILFCAQSVMGNLSIILSIKKDEDQWKQPQIASFSGQYFDLEPFFSPDGLKFYFVSNRPLNSTSTNTKDFDIWFMERETDDMAWSEPKNLGSPINTPYDEFYPSVTLTGNLYFTRDNPHLKNKDDIYFSECNNNQFKEPIALSNAINSDGYEYNAFIAPDESFLIYGCYQREGGFGSGDLYISFKTDTDWTASKNLGEVINSDKMDYCPFVDLKTKRLYYTSKIDNTKTSLNKPLKIHELFDEFNKYDNGLSRLYSVSIETWLNNNITN